MIECKNVVDRACSPFASRTDLIPDSREEILDLASVAGLEYQVLLPQSRQINDLVGPPEDLHDIDGLNEYLRALSSGLLVNCEVPAKVLIFKPCVGPVARDERREE